MGDKFHPHPLEPRSASARANEMLEVAITGGGGQLRKPPASCNLSKSFDLIGDRWILLILRSAPYGLRRFDDIQSDIAIPRSVLSKRLGKLVERGLMVRRSYREDGKRPRPEYRLTNQGRTLALPFFAITEVTPRW